jgi:hypothetical protein
MEAEQQGCGAAERPTARRLAAGPSPRDFSSICGAPPGRPHRSTKNNGLGDTGSLNIYLILGIFHRYHWRRKRRDRWRRRPQLLGFSIGAALEEID